VFDDYFSKDRNNVFIKALLLGVLPLIKINGLLISAILGIYYIYRIRDLKKVMIVGLIAIFIALPILIRNYFFINSPFYPAFLNIFPGTLHPGEIAYYKGAMTAPLTWSSLTFHLKAFFA